jgi:hypothetical protein
VRTLLIFALLVTVALAQDPKPSAMPCVADSETVYAPGERGIKPPQPLPSNKAKGAPEVQGQMSFELLVNSEGSVCEVKILQSKDRLSAYKVAKYIEDDWKFEPATKEGKPVAVRFRVNFASR